MVRPCAERSRSSAAVMHAAAWCALLLALAGCSRSSGAAASAAGPPASSAFTLMQMNLCLSGLAGCYGRVAYPAGVHEALAQIIALRPDAVTVNEACRGDVTMLARRAGYHLRFSTVIYGGKPLPCIHPRGRGVFGDAVLTASAVESTDSGAFETQAGPEQRRWLCVSTRAAVDVCTSHLASHEPDEAAANEPQCAELAAVLARRAVAHTVMFGGDVNHRTTCAPSGFWTETDDSAHQNPGDQHVYGTRALNSPTTQVRPAAHTDHDFLLVRARRT